MTATMSHQSLAEDNLERAVDAADQGDHTIAAHYLTVSQAHSALALTEAIHRQIDQNRQNTTHLSDRLLGIQKMVR